MATKEKRIYTTEHAMLGHTAAPSDVLAPGEYALLDEDNDAHKAILKDIDAGRAPHLRVEEVDVEAEKRNEEARQKLLDDLEANAAEQHAQALEAARVAAGQGQFNPEEHPVPEVLDYLKQASPEEVQRVQSLEASSSRGSKQVADFEPKGE